MELKKKKMVTIFLFLKTLKIKGVGYLHFVQKIQKRKNKEALKGIIIIMALSLSLFLAGILTWRFGAKKLPFFCDKNFSFFKLNP